MVLLTRQAAAAVKVRGDHHHVAAIGDEEEGATRVAVPFCNTVMAACRLHDYVPLDISRLEDEAAGQLSSSIPASSTASGIQGYCDVRACRGRWAAMLNLGPHDIVAVGIAGLHCSPTLGPAMMLPLTFTSLASLPLLQLLEGCLRAAATAGRCTRTMPPVAASRRPHGLLRPSGVTDRRRARRSWQPASCIARPNAG